MGGTFVAGERPAGALFVIGGAKHDRSGVKTPYLRRASTIKVTAGWYPTPKCGFKARGRCFVPGVSQDISAPTRWVPPKLCWHRRGIDEPPPMAVEFAPKFVETHALWVLPPKIDRRPLKWGGHSVGLSRAPHVREPLLVWMCNEEPCGLLNPCTVTDKEALPWQARPQGLFFAPRRGQQGLSEPSWAGRAFFTPGQGKGTGRCYPP